MEHTLWPIFIVNIGINSLLSFFTLSLLIFFCLKLLRINNARVQAFILLIPFIKLVLDISCYQFSNWALAHNLNPLTAPEGSRMLSATFMLPPFLHLPLCSIDCHLQEGQTFTFADLFCLTIGPRWTFGCAVGIIGGCVWFMARGFLHYRRSHIWFRKMLILSESYARPFQDPLLQKRVLHKKVVIYLSDWHHAPCICGHRNPAIFVPRALFEKLTVLEFEAIIAHEIAHLEQGDLLVNACLFWISHLFWWIPSGYVKRKLELAQEMACDRLLHTNLDRVHLAEALYKASLWLHSAKLPAFARPLTTPHQIVQRLQVLIGQPRKTETALLKGIKFVLLFCWTTVLVFGKFWTF